MMTKNPEPRLVGFGVLSSEAGSCPARPWALV